MVTKEINNPRMRNFIRDKLGLPKYGNGFDKVIEELFIREIYVLNLRPEEILEDIENFKNSVNEIVVENFDDDFLGEYVPLEKKIKINSACYQKIFESKLPEEAYTMYFETIIHECLHGTQTRKNGMNRAEGYNEKLQNRTHALYEIATQATAIRITRSKKIDDTSKFLNDGGYGDEIFAIPLISATFGVSEQDVIKYCMRDREKLIDVLDENINNRELTYDLLNRIEEQLEYIHSANYPDPNQINFKNMSKKGKLNITSSAINNLVSICEEVMADRIKKVPVNCDKDLVDNLIYDYKKIKDTLEYQGNKYGYRFFNENYNEFLYNMHNGQYSGYVKKSLGILASIFNEKNPNMVVNVTEAVMAIKTENYNYLNMIGGENYLDYNVSGRVVEKHIHDEYDDYKIWDNSSVFEALQNGTFSNSKFNGKRLDVGVWEDINSLSGLEKLSALKYVFLANKRRCSVNTKQVLMNILDQQDDYFGDNDRIYSKITGSNMDVSPDLYNFELSPKETMIKYFNSSNDKIYIAALIADRFIKKAFDNNGNPKKMVSEAEGRMQCLLYHAIEDGLDNGENGIAKAKKALTEILVNENYECISDLRSQEKLFLYGKSYIFDIVSQPLVDELLNERRIEPKKKDVLNYVSVETNEKFPGQSSARLVMLLKKFKEGENSLNISRYLPENIRYEFNSSFKNQRDYEDLLGIICDEYSKHNYKNFSSEDSKANTDIQYILNGLGPDEFREAMIDAFFRNDYSRIANKDAQNLLSRNPEFMVTRMADIFVRNSENVRFADLILDNGNYQGFVQPVNKDDLSVLVSQEMNNRGVYKETKHVMSIFERIKNGFNTKKQTKNTKDIER